METKRDIARNMIRRGDAPADVAAEMKVSAQRLAYFLHGRIAGTKRNRAAKARACIESGGAMKDAAKIANVSRAAVANWIQIGWDGIQAHAPAAPLPHVAESTVWMSVDELSTKTGISVHNLHAQARLGTVERRKVNSAWAYRVTNLTFATDTPLPIDEPARGDEYRHSAQKDLSFVSDIQNPGARRSIIGWDDGYHGMIDAVRSSVRNGEPFSVFSHSPLAGADLKAMTPVYVDDYGTLKPWSRGTGQHPFGLCVSACKNGEIPHVAILIEQKEVPASDEWTIADLLTQAAKYAMNGESERAEACTAVCRELRLQARWMAEQAATKHEAKDGKKRVAA